MDHNNPDKCSILIIVSKNNERDELLEAISERVMDIRTVKKANVTYFETVTGHSCAITTSMASEPRARMTRMAELCEKTQCEIVALINPNYEEEDLKKRHIKLPIGCKYVFAETCDQFVEELHLELRHEQLNKLLAFYGEPERVSAVRFPNLDNFDYRSSNNNALRHMDDDDEDFGLHDSIGEYERQFEEMEQQQRQQQQQPIQHISMGRNNTFISGLHGLDPVSFINGGMARTPVTPLTTARGGPTPAERLAQRPAATTVAGNAQTAATQRNAAAERARNRIAENRLRNTVTTTVKKAKETLSRPREEDADIDAMEVSAENNTCMICMSAHITTAALPCRHYLFCNRCIKTWMQAGDKKCPMCKGDILTTVQLITHLNVNDEHRRRLNDPVEVDKLIIRLKERIEKLEIQSKKIKSEKK